MRNRTPQVNFHISQDWAEIWMQNHTSFQCLELTIPTLGYVSFLCLFSWSACNLKEMLHFSKNPHILKVPKWGLQSKEPKQSRLRLRKHGKQQGVQGILSTDRQSFGDNLPVRLQSCSALRTRKAVSRNTPFNSFFLHLCCQHGEKNLSENIVESCRENTFDNKFHDKFHYKICGYHSSCLMHKPPRIRTLIPFKP